MIANVMHCHLELAWYNVPVLIEKYIVSLCYLDHKYILKKPLMYLLGPRFLSAFYFSYILHYAAMASD